MKQLLRAIAALAFFCLASLAAAGQRDAEIEALVDKAVEERTFLVSCSALSEYLYTSTLKYWEFDRKNAVMPLLVKLGVAPEVFVRLIKKTESKNLMVKINGTAGELISYCRDNQDLMKKLYSLGGVSLPRDLGKMLGQ